MLKVFVKGANQKGYVVGFAFQPVVQNVQVPANLGDMKGVPDLAKITFRTEQQQILVPVTYVVLEDGRTGVAALAELVPLLSEREARELVDAVVPPEALEEAKAIAERRGGAETGEPPAAVTGGAAELEERDQAEREEMAKEAPEDGGEDKPA